MNRLFCRFALFFLFFSFFCNRGQQQNDFYDVIVMAHNVINKEAINIIFPSATHINALSFESDIFFPEEEFLYLCDFKTGDDVTADDIVVGLEYCLKKNKFTTIKITCVAEENGVRLHVKFESIWTFRKIKIHNIYQGKHALLQFYVMEKGEVFDESKHDHSINKIKEYLINSSYYDVAVSSTLEYDNATKEVIVHLYIKKGRRYSFGTITKSGKKEIISCINITHVYASAFG
jgi:outer membrane protein assembly factor BamA